MSPHTDNELKIIKAQARIDFIDLMTAQLRETRQKLVKFIDDLQNPTLLEEEFQKLWEIYPERHGMKRERKSALTRFKNMKGADRKLLSQAILNYRKCDEARRGFARDMVRFLKDDFWPAWLTPNEKMMAERKDPKNDKAKVDNLVNDVVSEITRKSNTNPSRKA